MCLGKVIVLEKHLVWGMLALGGCHQTLWLCHEGTHLQGPEKGERSEEKIQFHTKPGCPERLRRGEYERMNASRMTHAAHSKAAAQLLGNQQDGDQAQANVLTQTKQGTWGFLTHSFLSVQTSDKRPCLDRKPLEKLTVCQRKL